MATNQEPLFPMDQSFPRLIIEEPFFLFIGNTDAESAVSKLKVTSHAYKKKKLESRPENWIRILMLLESRNLIATLVKLTGSTINLMEDSRYSELALDLFQSLSQVRHIIFIHESILQGSESDESGDSLRTLRELSQPRRSQAVESDDFEDFFDAPSYYQNYFEPPSETALELVLNLATQYGLELVPYQTNAELSVLASTFIEQNENSLLFRIYIPSGRLWANEADNLLNLFRDWLTRVKQLRVRQDSYRTGKGEVYEFYGEGAIQSEQLNEKFAEFSNFLDTCVDDPSKATRILESEQVDQSTIVDIVARYTKQARRIRIDLKHERESRILAIRQGLESELSETSLDWHNIAVLVDSIVPQVSGISSALALTSNHPSLNPSPPVTVTINQQLIESVHGLVTQNYQGTASFGAEANEILRLIEQFGGNKTPNLVSDLHELEDDDARAQNRLAAKQRLKSFLFKVGGHTGNIAVGLLQKYLEARLGLSGS